MTDGERAGSGTGSGRLSLDHLLALNDEIAALARAGMPLERGLLAVSGDVPGALRSAMASLGARMERGASLPEALAAEGERFPPVYRAVVEAGLKAGRLAAALERLADLTRSYIEARRVIGLALWYPLIVLIVAYTLFLGLATQMIPRFLTTYEVMRVPVPRFVALLGRAGAFVWYWGPVLPVVVVLAACWWTFTGTATSLRPGVRRSPLRRFPWMQSLLAHYEAANFADMLGLLIEHDVPYPEALVLASQATGDPDLARSGRVLAEAVTRGEVPRAEALDSPALTPLLRWLLATGQRQSALVGALRQLAAGYRKRAGFEGEKIRLFVPSIFLLAIGCSATVVYALTLFVPFAYLLRGVAAPLP